MSRLIIAADRYRYVAGVDTHARTHTLAMVDANTGRELDTRAFPSTAAAHERVADWLQRHYRDATNALIAMAGTNLMNRGYQVVQAPSPTRSARQNQGNSDSLDAVRAARAVMQLNAERLTAAKTGPASPALKILLVARQSMTRERTAGINALTALLRTIDPGMAARRPLSPRVIRTVTAWRSRREGVTLRIAPMAAVRLAQRILNLEAQLKQNPCELEVLARDAAPDLLYMPGVGAVSAAVILSCWWRPGGVRSEAASASLAGTCPLPASSANMTRQRLNRSGDRQLNRAMHTITLVGMNHHPRTKAYVQRRTLEGRTNNEITRSLKRHVTRQVYRTPSAASRD